MAKNKKNKTKRQAPTSTKSSKTIFWIIGFIAICFLGIILLSNMPQKEVAIDYSEQPYIGEEAAPVEIIEFGDYKCPACKSFIEQTYPFIEEEFVNTGKAKFYFMNYPFINVDSTRAAVFAETVFHELGNDVYWDFHHLLYEKQPADHAYENVDLYTPEFLEETLAEVVDEQQQVDKVMQAFADEAYQDALETDLSYVQQLNVNSTPTLFINGKKFEGTTIDDFTEMVDEAAGEQ